MAEKKYDEFIFVMVGGLLLIFIMAIFVVQQKISLTTRTPGKYYEVFYLDDVKIIAENSTNEIYSAKDIVVKSAFLSDKGYSFFFPVENSTDLKFILIRMVVEGINPTTDLIVEFNKLKIFKSKMDFGKISLRVPNELVPRDAIFQNNLISIYPESVGWQFWKTSEYKIHEINVYEFRTLQQFEERSFNVNDYRVYSNFTHGKIVMEVRESQQTADLIIELNSRIIYSGRPFTKTLSVEFSPPLTDIVLGENKIKFYTDGEAKYDLRNIRVYLYYN